MKRYPFKFLDAYTREDKDFFFGRTEEIEALYEMIFQTDLLLIYGASGTGKTSLIQCGLAAKFQSHDWLALNIRRGNNLNVSFEKALKEAAGDSDPDQPDLDWLDEDWDKIPGAAVKKSSPLARRFREIYLRHFKPLYLIFDQFEELYILGDKAEQETFVQTVKEILQVEQPVKIIISIREEYLGDLYEFERQVPELLRKKLRVEPMNLDKVTSVIKGVANQPQSNVRLEKAAEDRITETIFTKIRGQEKTLSIQLPYLQVFLDKLYLQTTRDDSRTAEAVFTLSTLEQMGDIGDVLREFLEEQVLKIAQKLKQDPEKIWKILSPFVTLEGTKEPLTAKALSTTLSDLPKSLLDEVLGELLNRRILRFTEQEQLYEIAHDALAKQIHDKRSDEDIALLEVRRLIKNQVALNLDAREFFTEKQLQFIEPYLPKLQPGQEEANWMEQSRMAIAQQKAAAERRQREELEKAQLQAEKERLLAEKANNALAEVRLKNVSIFHSFAGLGKELIESLDYLPALEKLKVAVEIDIDFQIKKQQLLPLIEELLFFFSEGGRRWELARKAAALLVQLEPSDLNKKLIQSCLNQSWDHRNLFRPLLENLESFDALKARYYPEMISVPLGESGVFDMGSPDGEPGRFDREIQHSVKLKPYAMASTPVTFYQFALFSENKDRGLASRTPAWGRIGDHPVVNVSWYETVEYANWLNEQFGLEAGYDVGKKVDSDPNNQVQYDYLKWKINWKSGSWGYRLPMEAEWELAAKGGVGAPYSIYAGSDDLEEVGWYWENSGDKPLSGDWDLNRIYDNNGRTHRVKAKKPNAIGLYDMSGNVLEWCWDWYSQDYYRQCQEKGTVEQPSGPESSSDGRVVRGGSWFIVARFCRTANRNFRNPDNRNLNLGFRLVFVPQSVASSY